MASWEELLIAALGGGIVVKFCDIAYQEFRHWKSRSQTATEFVEKNLDPLLKSADELVGKLRSLAESDFKPILKVKPDEATVSNHEFASLLFLFVRFWAQIELIRLDGMSVAMAKDKRGAQLQNFFDCLESRRVRIIDRILQRAAGEALLIEKSSLDFVRFVAAFEGDAEFRRWIMPLARFLSRLEHRSERQTLLQYVAVIHALIDTLDPDHQVTRERPSWPNKLTKRSWRDLNYRVFGVYLKFVPNRQKYLGPPKNVSRKDNQTTRQEESKREKKLTRTLCAFHPKNWGTLKRASPNN